MNIECLSENSTVNAPKTVAYIIGNAFEALTQLPNVYTVNQFFSAVFSQALPEHRLWIVGQGIHVCVRELLSICEQQLPALHLHFGSLAVNAAEEHLQIHGSDNPETVNQEPEALEWRNFQFTDATRVKADLKLVNLSEEALLTHDFLFSAARALCEKACRHSIENGKLLIKQAQLQSFHRCFPLPLMVETQFHLANDNKRSLKSLTRFYQDYACIAEVSMSFDLYTEIEARQLLHALGTKTFGHFADKINEEN